MLGLTKTGADTRKSHFSKKHKNIKTTYAEEFGKKNIPLEHEESLDADDFSKHDDLEWFFGLSVKETTKGSKQKGSEGKDGKRSASPSKGSKGKATPVDPACWDRLLCRRPLWMSITIIELLTVLMKIQTENRNADYGWPSVTSRPVVW